MVKARILEETEEETLQKQAEDLAQLNEDEGGEVFRAIEEMRGAQGTVVVIIKLSPQEEAGVCDSIPVAEFSIDELKRRYGAGGYKIRVRGPKGWIPGGGNVRISTVGIKQKSAPSSSGGDFQTFLELQAQRDAQRSAKIWELVMLSVPALLAGLFNRQAPASDIPALVAALKPAPGPTLQDLSATMVNMQQLTAPKSSESNVDMILKVFESAQNLMGGEKSDAKNGEGSNWVDVIRDLIKVAPDAIKPMLEARMAAMQSARPTMHASIVPSVALAANKPEVSQVAPTINTSVAPSVVSATNGGNNMQALWEPIARNHLNKVLQWALKDRDPEVYAEVFIDELPDLSAYLTVDQVLEHLQNPQWFEKICELEPALKDHKQFCEEMHTEVIEIVKQIKAEFEENNKIPLETPIGEPETEPEHGTE